MYFSQIDPLSLPAVRYEIYLCEEKTFEESLQMKGESSPFYRLYLVQAGQCHLSSPLGKFRLKAGDFAIIPAIKPFDIHYFKGFKLHYMRFNAFTSGGLKLLDGLELKGRCRPKDMSKRVGDFMKINVWMRKPESSNGFEIHATLSALLNPFVTDTKAAAKRNGLSGLGPLFDYLEQNLDQDIGVTDLAKVVNRHPNYLSNKFSETLGVTLTAYIQRRRIERAQILLLSSDAPLKAIAPQVGFRDAFYFSKIFKKITGISPFDYRKEQASGRF